MDDLTLKACPFCGSTKLTLEYKTGRRGFAYTDDGGWHTERRIYAVRCNCCHARGGAVGGTILDGYSNFDYANPFAEPRKERTIPPNTTTVHELQAKAVAAWNRREEP